MQRTYDTTWHFRVSTALKTAVQEYADQEDLSCASAVKNLVKAALREQGMWPRRPADPQANVSAV
ncbi:MAG TPA: hypothetical protein VGV41_12485 [Pseudolabrys sp.]|uniref:hypothetical protein n=1 Tax=Pseudolabrys sp. TaxID=1960880 RepID=UPI002DDD7AC7|nr:hypothetical protein [Pseudolabrys sp.]HEV2629448.1 hypothetical protein [Pseudolabrys sp.]